MFLPDTGKQVLETFSGTVKAVTYFSRHVDDLPEARCVVLRVLSIYPALTNPKPVRLQTTHLLQTANPFLHTTQRVVGLGKAVSSGS